MSPRVPGARELASARRHLRQLAASGQDHCIRHHGANLRWRRWGSGPDLVLLHGGHGSWLHWVRNIEALATQFSVWLPDMPGFGDSDALPGHPHVADRQPRLVEALDAGLRQLLGDEARFDLAGFSFGGLTAAQLASASERVRRLALMGTGGHGGELRQAAELLNWRQTEGLQRWQAHARNLQLLMLRDAAQVDAQALVVHACASQATRYRSRAISRDAQLPGVLSTLTGELLLVWGEHDVTARPADIGPVLLDGRTNRRMQTVANAGHWVQYEQSDAINRLLTDWFDHTTPQDT